MRVKLVYIMILMAALLFARTSYAADAVVGTGTPASCTEAAFDAALLAASSGGGSSADLQDLALAYNAGGGVTSIVDALNSGQRQCFAYDWLDRLTSAFTGNGDCSAYSSAGDGPYEHDYSYDPIGNITSFDGAGYSYSSSQPPAVSMKRFWYRLT